MPDRISGVKNEPSTTTKLRNIRRGHADSEGRRVWGFQNTLISSYETSFKNLLNGKSVSDLIEGKTKPTVIDLMAPPYTIHSLLTSMTDSNGRGLAVTLKDHSLSDLPDDVRETYFSSRVTTQFGDITDSETWVDIVKWLDNKKADLVMERAVDGLSMLPMSKRYFGILIAKVWSILDSDGGIFLFETPRHDLLKKQGIDLDAWVQILNKSGVDVVYDPGNLESESTLLRTGKIMLKKTSESPSVLPSL